MQVQKGKTIHELVEKSDAMKGLARVFFNLKLYAKSCRDAPLLAICDELEFYLNKLLNMEVEV